LEESIISSTYLKPVTETGFIIAHHKKRVKHYFLKKSFPTQPTHAGKQDIKSNEPEVHRTASQPGIDGSLPPLSALVVFNVHFALQGK